ncbi:MAG TPA: HAD hydrolase family protein [Pyrinomonadaceae bacterium]|nr:HAD hydrolase family protein [Chloracidobacterium sp.]MBP9936634.1 HAD hydrolase family protein [Pyrinomonadaceae bacterium]MBK7802709.1 HAD hydrolase family protein [Chloracidobacterium sp.]MBK9767138.1 HAD hydrolase family protein [Chloracidobacterium sp.]MBL0240229.1 HAD hydrolase family protein [Chloracidobacterium sp.]
MRIEERARRIKLLIMDCDGVLTDGRLYFSAGGETMKVFHARDGQGIASWHKAGFRSGIISGRGATEIIQRRADELGMTYIRTNSQDKVVDLSEIIAAAGVSLDEVAYVGDDIGDVEVMKIVGLPVAVADAAIEAINAAIFVTDLKGGKGAIRQVTDLLLNSK